jgi:iron complex transport system substrate-binding protein
MKWLALPVILGAGLCLAACSGAPEPVQKRQRPTIVSLNPCSDAVLAEVADPGQILALSHFSRNPASSSMDLDKARQFPSVSDSVEEVLALGPDLVVAGSFLPPATASALREMGVPVMTMPIATNVAQSRHQVMALARASGHPGRGRTLNARIDAALAEAAPPTRDTPSSAIVWQAGGIVPGDDTLIADLLRRTGFVSLSAARGLGQADYLPLEAMLAEPPRVILVAGDPSMNENRLLNHPALAALDGTSRVRLDPSLLWCGGPTIIRAARRLKDVREAL